LYSTLSKPKIAGEIDQWESGYETDEKSKKQINSIVGRIYNKSGYDDGEVLKINPLPIEDQEVSLRPVVHLLCARAMEAVPHSTQHLYVCVCRYMHVTHNSAPPRNLYALLFRVQPKMLAKGLVKTDSGSGIQGTCAGVNVDPPR